jgi:chromosomal replication initiator protein
MGPAGRDAGAAAVAPVPAAPARDRAGRADALHQVHARLVQLLGEETVSNWLRSRATLRLSSSGYPPALEVHAPSKFMTDLVARRFGAALREALDAAVGASAAIRYVVDEPRQQAPAAPAPAAPVPAQAEPARAPRRSTHSAGSAPNPAWHRLEDFVVGASNRLAYEAAVRVAEGTLGVRSGPLFIHGACGLGKTHLLQGIARRFLERHPGATVRYTTGEAFTNEFIAAVSQGRAMGARGARGDAFRRAYRDVDLLCVDDVHFLANKTATQTELLHTFDAIDSGMAASGRGTRIVIASDAHPRAVHRFSEALVSRFLSGLVVRLDPPDAELCERIVAALAARRGLPMDAHAARAIAEHAAVLATSFRGAAQAAAPGYAPFTSVRELEGLVTRVEACWRLDAAPDAPPITRVTVDRALSGLAGGSSGGARRPIRCEQIIATVCHQLGVEQTDFTGRGRHPRVVLARSVVAVLARRLTTLSFPEIARAMGRPNHSTIITAYQRLTRRMEAGEACGLDGHFADLTLAQLVDRLGAMVARA